MSQSLGSLGDSLGLTVMTVYALAVAQLPATFIATINYPPVRIDMFTAVARVVDPPAWAPVNGTGVDLSNPTLTHYMHGVSVSFAFLGVSGLCAMFATGTVYLRDKGLSGDSDGGGGVGASVCQEDFTTANAELTTNPTITMWNSVFLWLVVGGHALLAAVVCSPADVHGVVLFAVLIYVSMSGILQPKLQGDGTANASSYISSAYMGWGLMYAGAMTFLASSIPYDPVSARVQLVGAVAFADCFLLIVGHTWDAAPTLQVVMNCRLLYTVAWSVINIAMCVAASGAFSTQFFAPPVH